MHARLRSSRERRISVFDKLGSTNDYLKELAETGAPEGIVVIAAEQTSGKGRLGRSWLSPRGGAWFSLLLRPPIPVEQAGCISILIAVSLAHAIREHWGIPVGVKWPNDLYVLRPNLLTPFPIGERFAKLGGILIELSSRSEKIAWLVAGIGINVNNELPKATRVPATSLSRELGRTVALEEFFDASLEAIMRDYERFLAEGFDFVRTSWQRLSVLPRYITVETYAKGIEAEVLGLSPLGKLVVRLGGGVRELASEEVTLCQLQLS